MWWFGEKSQKNKFRNIEKIRRIFAKFSHSLCVIGRWWFRLYTSISTIYNDFFSPKFRWKLTREDSSSISEYLIKLLSRFVLKFVKTKAKTEAHSTKNPKNIKKWSKWGSNTWLYIWEKKAGLILAKAVISPEIFPAKKVNFIIFLIIFATAIE